MLPAHEGPVQRDEANALAHAAATLADDLDAAAIIVPTRTGISAQRLAAFRPRRPILAYSRVPETTRRLQLIWGVQAVDLKPVPGLDSLHATLAAAGRDLPPGSRAVVLDIAAPGSGLPSLVNAIKF
jgi:pyruvate kinase